MKRLFYSRLHRHILGKPEQRLRSYITDHPGHLDAAQRLHAEVYLAKGYIYEQDVNGDGKINDIADPHKDGSTYFVTTRINEGGKEEVVASARHIRSHKKGGSDLPLLQQASIEQKYRQEIQGYLPSQCVEVSALVKRRGFGMVASLLLYREMWRHSRDRGDKLWLMACSPALLKRLQQLFGSTLIQIGPPTPYTGEEIIPVMLKVEEGEARLRREARRSWHPGRRFLYRELLAFFTADDHFLLRQYD
ncbi:hypothetical protein EPO04_04125 [Patescibacteria group bacterium]|nr:MAG: hypothetical protein EPO04_04125 [Patescibacteria group bacterium]